MKIFAIADLHLSLNADKPMDIYGGQWVGHMDRLERKWKAVVEDEDLVVIAGDISWSLKKDDAAADLDWVASLPGMKVLTKGNHDLWWTSVSKLNQLNSSMYFLQNTHFPAGDYAICGTRGWICPGEPEFTAHDEKIYNRELGRLRMSLESARKAGYTKIMAAIHYPPVNDRQEHSGFTSLFEEYGVERVVYGHLHGTESHLRAMQGILNGVEYRLVSCDYLQCCPLLMTR